MSYPHCIRLRGPWEWELLEGHGASAAEPLAASPDASRTADSSAATPPPRVTLPTSWHDQLGALFCGRVRYLRHFNRPSGLQSNERVWLVNDGVDAHGAWRLNGAALGTIDGYALPAACDVTALLQGSNTLEIDVASHDAPVGAAHGEANVAPLRPGRAGFAGGPIGETRLEIRTAWQVDDFAIYWSASPQHTLCAQGRVIQNPLVPDTAPAKRIELLLAACGKELLVQQLAPGQDFACAAPLDAWPNSTAEPTPTPIEAQLLVDGHVLWRTTLTTAPPRPAQIDAAARFADPAALAQLPWRAALEHGSEALAGVAQQMAGGWIGSLAVQPDVVYTELDFSRISVVQHIPLAWAPQVAPRLANHRSIVAWVTSAAELARADSALLAKLSFGRPWLAHAIA